LNIKGSLFYISLTELIMGMINFFAQLPIMLKTIIFRSDFVEYVVKWIDAHALSFRGVFYDPV